MIQRYNCQEKLDASHSLGWKGWLTHSRDKAYCNSLMWDQWLTTRHFTGLSIHDLTPTTIPRQPCPAVNSYISILFFFSIFSPSFHFLFFPFVSLNPSLSYVLSFIHFLSPLFNLLFSLFFFFLYFYLIFSFLFLFVFFPFSLSLLFFLLFFIFSFAFNFFLLFLFFFVFLFFVCLHLFCCFTSNIYNNI